MQPSRLFVVATLALVAALAGCKDAGAPAGGTTAAPPATPMPPASAASN